ncbi:AAA family ATPase [Macrococcus bovicus]|uniref:ATP-binding protein n=1 Tax=Macrococcus bovicus TaxID=69968 RepID=A0A4R6C140_9STAP|nr:AAA family ATPase [Macrococcus bovicus]TDM14878.1 ATP-binding protein [Macrococcus bovicus]
MQNLIRIKNVKIENVKNVKYGEFSTKIDFENFNDSDVLGFYGQNGSGKTAVVDTFILLEKLMDLQSLNSIKKKLVNIDGNSASIKIEYIVKLNNNKEYYIDYEVEIGIDEEDNYFVQKEVIRYKENQEKKRYKHIVSYQDTKFLIRTQPLSKLNEKNRISAQVAIKIAEKERTSIVFQTDLISVYKKLLNNEEYMLLKCIVNEFRSGLHIIKNSDYGLLMANILMPFNIHHESIKGTVPLNEYYESESLLLDDEMFDILKNDIFPSINVVLPAIIPGLTIDIRKTGEKTKKNGSTGIEFELLSIRGETSLPLSEESEGIKKIVSMLSVLSAIFKEPNSCVVIDELDAGVFEYLLGELLKIVDESGKGQLIFTSHNLRIVELLPIKNIWFTTTNPYNRYIQLKYTNELSNNRDIYIRALQIKNQQEELFDKIDNFEIRRAFKKLARRGKLNEL